METVHPIARKFNLSSTHTKLFGIILVVSLVGGILTGYFLASSGGSKPANLISLNEQKADTAQEDNRTFRDFAEGVVQKKPEPTKAGEYSEGTHLLVRTGAVSVAMTSSVVDLSLYEGKKVKVFGETQKAIKEGWLMDVGRVEEQK